MKITFAEIKIQMSGREMNFLRYAGLSEKQLSGKHQPCESCGGKDTYRTDKRAGNGSFFCGQAGGGSTGGDWIDHLCHVKGMTTQEVYGLSCEYLGIKEMNEEDKEVIRLKARRQREIDEAKKKLIQDNEYWDNEIKFQADESIILAKERGLGSMVTLEEIAQLRRASQLMIGRINSIMMSSSFGRAKQFYGSLNPFHGTPSERAILYAKELKNNDISEKDSQDFVILCVREMLIDRMKDKRINSQFIAEVLAALKALPAEERTPAEPWFPTKESQEWAAKIIKPVFDRVASKTQEVAA